jgi:hypothetical protein
MKLSQKIPAVLLSVVILLSSFSVVALANGTCTCQYAPTVYVTGIATDPLYLDQGAENEKMVFPPSGEVISDAINNILEGTSNLKNLTKSPDLQDYEALSQVIDNVAYEVFKYLAFDFNGNSKYNVTSKFRKLPSNKSLKDHKHGTEYHFYYDWRQDPFSVAQQLDKYINHILNGTGHDKVNLIGFSLGGAVALTYISEYGNDKIASLQMRCSTANGTSICGQPLAGKVDSDANALIGIIDDLMPDNNLKIIISFILTALKKAGIMNFTIDSLMKIVKECTDYVYAGKVGEIFASIPSLWVLVPDSEYEDAKNVLLKDRNYPNFIESIDRYHYEIQAKNNEIIDAFIADGGKFSVIVKYGLQVVPVCKDYDIQSDGVNDAIYSSFGATCAKIGTTLGDDYVQAIDDGHNHVSADKFIDASTCDYPEYTWFVKGVHHSIGCDYINALSYKLFYAEEQLDVWSDEEFPQFVQFDSATEKWISVTDDTQNQHDTLSQKFRKYLIIAIFICSILAFFKLKKFIFIWR